MKKMVLSDLRKKKQEKFKNESTKTKVKPRAKAWLSAEKINQQIINQYHIWPINKEKKINSLINLIINK